MYHLVLNRPLALNTLSLEMVRLLRQGLEAAARDARVSLVMLSGSGERAFCAGGDVKALAALVEKGAWQEACRFFREEYLLDLRVHRFPKAVVALADGITMGGGLGLIAGADVVVATERTRMAMPETAIGFFPDVGATGWLFAKCPPGYPEFLALTGTEVRGTEAVRLGLATHLVEAARLPALRAALEDFPAWLPPDKAVTVARVRQIAAALAEPQPPANPHQDAWVARHFADKATISEITASLAQCPPQEAGYSRAALETLGRCSPTALAVTLRLMRRHQGLPLEEVFAGELEAACWLIRHPDYREGIRAKLIDRDHQPRWQPASPWAASGLCRSFRSSGAGTT
jgi:enoyl-CoA hydratase/carnithine racemase